MTAPTEFQIVNAMARYGGSFAQAIAAAATRADERNYAKLQAAFPELWAEYADTARLIVARDAQQEGVA